MTNTVLVRKRHLDRFRKFAKESSLEIQAYLVGEVVSPDFTVIDYFVYPTEYGLQTKQKAAWYRKDYEQVKAEAEKRGRRIVGSIHSHPNWDAVLSPSDYEVCVVEGHRVCGIVSTDKKSTRVRFWVMDCALPAEIVYAKKNTACRTPTAHEAAPEQSQPAHP